jgi:hypothetical protein
VVGHPERFIVGVRFGVVLKAGRILGAVANFKADASHHP